MELQPEEIRELRRRHGWTQVELAEELGTDAVTVSRWERGVSRPRPSALRRLRRFDLAAGPASRARFVDDPECIIRRLERMRQDQLSLKRRARRID